LVFVTPTTHKAQEKDIAWYNDHVQSAADAAGLGDWTWRAVGSTSAIHAKDNAPVTSDVYINQNGTVTKVADAANFYSATHLTTMNYRPNGDAVSGQYVWTGSNVDGTSAGGARWTLGPSTGNTVRDSSGTAGFQYGCCDPASGSKPLYGLSEELTVSLPPAGTVFIFR